MINYNLKMGKLFSKCPNRHLKASSPSKISKYKNCAFGLPAGTKYSCPNATKSCNNCYAMKKRFLFKNTMSVLMNNWKTVRKYERKNDIDGLTNELNNVVPNNSKYFRLNETGDFYSQFYLDAWKRTIETRKDTKFWGYTRSFNLDYKDIVKLPNFNLLVSTDDYNFKDAKKFAKKYGLRLAFGPYKHNKKIPENSIVCRTTNKKMEIEGACLKCKFCISKNKKLNVVFLEH